MSSFPLEASALAHPLLGLRLRARPTFPPAAPAAPGEMQRQGKTLGIRGAEFLQKCAEGECVPGPPTSAKQIIARAARAAQTQGSPGAAH